MATYHAYGYDKMLPTGDTAPTSPADCDLWMDTTSGILWRWSGGVSRWMSQRMLVSIAPFGASNSAIPSPGSFISHSSTISSTWDCYVYSTNHNIYVATTLNNTNYWTISNGTSSRGFVGGDVHDTAIYFSLAVNGVVSKNGSANTTATNTGSPGALYTYGVTADLVLLK